MRIDVPAALVLLALGTAAYLVWRVRRKKTAPPAGGDHSAYTQALNCLLEGGEEEAIRKLREAVREDTQNIDAYIRLGDLLRQRGELENALRVHRGLTVRSISDQTVLESLYRSLAEDYLACGKYQEAIACAKKIRAMNKRNAFPLRLMVRVYEIQREWDKAYEMEEELEKLERKRGRPFLALHKSHSGYDLLKRGKPREAERYFKDALRLDSECVPALLYLGDIYFQDGNLRRAISLWELIVTRFPKIAHIVFERLEKAYFERGNLGDIVAVYEAVLRDSPKNVRTLVELACLHQKKGDLREAVRVLREALEYDPSSTLARQHLIGFLHEMGQTEQAIDETKKLLEVISPRTEDFVCSECGYRSSDVLWRCPKCQEWETFI
ncbi:MAG: tetratricopeptide repeat protein [Candidatus Eiseniibacteriota bacterium]|nr:MAG: tetratricopeptide repeat protein [Candidatus Eisenbacteria bacterium]